MMDSRVLYCCIFCTSAFTNDFFILYIAHILSKLCVVPRGIMKVYRQTRSADDEDESERFAAIVSEKLWHKEIRFGLETVKRKLKECSPVTPWLMTLKLYRT